MQPQPDRDLVVATPERVSFDYQVAGLGTRTIAQVLDLLSVLHREDFVPLAHKPLAFVDTKIALLAPVDAAIVPANAAAPFGCGDINSQLAALRALDMSAGADARSTASPGAAAGAITAGGAATTTSPSIGTTRS